MLILVNYDNLNFEDEAKRLMNKLCEDEKNVFVDLAERVSLNSSTSVPSLEFTMLKNLFDTEVPELEKNVVLDGNILFTIMDNFDDFQRDFLFKQMNALGHVTAQLVDKEEKSDDSFQFSFVVGKEFFIDFKKKLDPLVKKVEESPLYKLLKSINAYGFYLGTCHMEDPPTKTVILPGGAGQKISYEEYANWVLSQKPLNEIEEHNVQYPEDGENEKYAYVRQHHPVELIAKKIVKK